MLEAHMTFAACLLSSCCNDPREHTLEKFLKCCKWVDAMLSSWAHMLDVFFFVILNNDTICQFLAITKCGFVAYVITLCYMGVLKMLYHFFSSFTHHEKILQAMLHTHKKFCARGFSFAVIGCPKLSHLRGSDGRKDD
jgi:hypothetical protein